MLSQRAAISLATVVVASALWFIFTSATGWIGAARFPSPPEFFAAFKQIAFTGYADARLHQHVLQSCRLVLMGFAVASAIGIPLGLWMGHSRRAEAFINPIFLLIRPIPPLAWIPLAIVWLGLGDAAKIMVIFFASFVPAVINSYTGVRNIEPHLIEAAQVLGARGSAYVFEVLIPGAMPMIFTGLRLSLQASWTTLVAAELVGALSGLGQVLSSAAQDIFPAMIFTGMVFVGLCGASMTYLLGLLERRALHWRQA